MLMFLCYFMWDQQKQDMGMVIDSTKQYYPDTEVPKHYCNIGFFLLCNTLHFFLPSFAQKSCPKSLSLSKSFSSDTKSLY